MAVTNTDKKITQVDPRLAIVALLRNRDLNMQAVVNKLHSLAKWHTKIYDSKYEKSINVCYNPEDGSFVLGRRDDPYYLFHICVTIMSGSQNKVELFAASKNWGTYLQEPWHFPKPYNEKSYKHFVYRSQAGLIAGMGERNDDLMRVLNSWMGKFVMLVENDLNNGVKTGKRSMF